MSDCNQNLNLLVPSGIRRFTALAKQTPGCIGLTIGEPDLDTPQPIKDAAAQALAQNRTHYAPNRGTNALRQAIAEYETKRGMACTPENVLVTVGATGALNTALTGILNPGDEVIIPTPAFSLYESITLAAGAKPVFLDLKQSGFQIDADALHNSITSKTKAIVVNSPCNPTGVALTGESLQTVADAARANDLFVICDNVYMGLSDPDTPDLSIGYALGDKLLYCQSFSKPYSMTGWRIGYLIADAALQDKFILLQAAQIAAVPTFVQDAAVAALQTDVSDYREIFGKRRKRVSQRLKQMGLSFPEPKGAFYLFPSIAKFGLSSEEFCTRMIREGGVAAVPGTCFGCEGHIRISCCYCDEELETGLDRLEQFLQRLPAEEG